MAVPKLAVLLAAGICAPGLANRQSAAPALQPGEVYDVDYPVDWASMTPQELRYRAQADYASAIAKLKKEAAEAEAAQREMERALKAYQDAEEAAKKAKLQAEEALRNKARYAQKIKELEAESAGMGQELTTKTSAVQSSHGGVAAAKQQLDGANQVAAKEAAEAEAAKKAAEDAKARLAQAEGLAGTAAGDEAARAAEIEKQQKEYELAKEKWTKEDNDVKAAQKRVDRAKAELAKFEETG